MRMDGGLAAALIALVGTIIAALIGYATSRLTSSTQRHTTEVEARGPEWQSFLEEVRKDNQDTKDELNSRIERLAAKVGRLEDEVKRVTGKYQVSLNYLLEWRRKHPRDPLVDKLPTELRPDLPVWWPPSADD